MYLLLLQSVWRPRLLLPVHLPLPKSPVRSPGGRQQTPAPPAAPLPLLHTSSAGLRLPTFTRSSLRGHIPRAPRGYPSFRATTTQPGWFLPTLLTQAVCPLGRHGFTRGRRELRSPAQRCGQVSAHREQRLLLPSSLPGFTHQLQKPDGGHCPPRFLLPTSFITAKKTQFHHPHSHQTPSKGPRRTQKRKNLLLVADSSKASAHPKASNRASATTAGPRNNTRVTQ